VKWGGSSPCSPITEEEVREGLKQRSIEPLQSEDIANAIAYAVGQPQRVSVNEILNRPTQQAHRIG
jgi:NADP-dependent 3-hydroxy acid dehydrogenase YdfG